MKSIKKYLYDKATALRVLLNDYYWKETAESMGLDIKKPDDNLYFGFWLYSQYGDAPWVWSQTCWSK